MNPKVLTETGWKTTATKCDVKDNGLQKALALFEKLAEEQHAERAKALGAIALLAANLKKALKTASDPQVAKQLGEIAGTAQAEQKKAEAAEAAACKAAAEAQKQEAQQKTNEAEEEDQADYQTKLVAALQKLKGAKDLVYQFLLCDSKPHCGVMLAKKISPHHKEELTRLTNGSKSFLPLGSCHFEDGNFVFAMEKPVSGLARKLQESIKNFTGKKFPIRVGSESAGADEEPARVSASGAATAQTPARTTLEKAPEEWHQARNAISTSIGQLKAAMRKEYADDAPEMLAGIEQSAKKLDGILNTLDHRLAEALSRAHAAKDAAARANELKNAKTLLMEHIRYVKSEPLIEHIDTNPFGVATNVKQRLAATLTHMAQAIG